MTEKTTERKFRENGTLVREWINGRLHLHAYHGETLVVDPMRFSTRQRGNFLEHGVESKYGDLFALEIKDYPDRAARSREGMARAKARLEWDYTGTDQWEMPRGPRVTGPNEDDLVAIIERQWPGKGQETLTKTLAMHKGDLPATKTALLGVKEFAKHWLDIQSERRAASVATLDTTADDFLRMLQG